jgi:hypothetical protein
MIDHAMMRTFAWLIVAALAVSGVFALTVDMIEGAVLIGLALTSAVALKLQHTFPSAIMLLLIVAASVNAAGYILGLWHERTLFDEIVHAFTTLVGIIALLWLATRDGRALSQVSGPAVLVSALVAGLGLGLAWEAFEWTIGIIGSKRDTLIDLAMDSLGAVAAGIIFAGLRGWRTPIASTATVEQSH